MEKTIKVLMINGSPRAEGNTALALHEMERVFAEQGIQVETVPDDDAPVGEDKETILYYGEGRSYTDTTTEGDKNVDQNKRKASIPVRYLLHVWQQLRQLSLTRNNTRSVTDI